MSGLTIVSPESGQSAIAVTGADTTLRGIVAGRATTSVNAATIEVAAAGLTTLEGMLVGQDAGPGTSPAVTSSGAGLAVTDSVIGSTRGDGIAITSSEANTIKRSQITSTGNASWAVSVTSAGDSSSAKKAVLESSILTGGPDTGGGLLAVSLNPAAPGISTAGPVTVEGRHITVAGGKAGVALDALAGGLVLTGAVGNVTGTFTSSILHGDNRAQHHVAGLLPPTAANTSTFSCTTCDGAKPTGNGTITWADGTPNTEDGKLFVDPAKRSYAIRADAPVIDKGGDLVAGESDKDVHGQARKTGAQTDIGADEFLNRAPTAAFGSTATTVRENAAVGFLSGATDPEAAFGGGIAEWRWDFGDGVLQTTTVGGVVHTYAKRGSYNVTLTVVDRQGAVSETTAPKTIVVRDGTPPRVAITRPAVNASLKLSAAKRKCKTTKPKAGSKAKPKRTCTKPKPKKLTVAGTATDESGLASVEVAVRIVSRSGASSAQTGTCEFHTGLRVVQRPCDKPVFRKARISGTAWSWTSRTRKALPTGRYEVTARATDTQGVVSTLFTAAAKTKLAFRVR